MARSFSDALARGHEVERRWVENIRMAGRAAAHGRKFFHEGHRPSRDRIPAPDALLAVSVEIKERSFSFLGPDSWPYPTVYLDDVDAREDLLHAAYVFVSRPTGAWVWVSGFERSQWTQREIVDSTRGHELVVLECPKSLLRHSSDLISLTFPQTHFDFVSAGMEEFLRGGGERESYDRFLAKAD
jgi:hypothetical protein